jgi:uncharacterized protein
MCASRKSPLRFNFGFLLEADLGTSRDIELDYPAIRVADDVTLRPLQGSFRATRTSNGIYLHGALTGGIEVSCTRCLAPIGVPLDLELDDLFHYRAFPPPGEYRITDTGIVDLAPLIRELALLAVPMQVFCRGECLGLCPVCGQELNEGPCDCPTDDIDPRLAVLRSLLPGQPEDASD